MRISNIVHLTIILALLAGMMIGSANDDDDNDKDKIKIKEKNDDGKIRIEYEGEFEGQYSGNPVIIVPVSTQTQSYRTNTIQIKNSAYNPSSLTVIPGSIIVWQNGDGTEHTVTSNSGLFDSGSLHQGSQFTLRFDTPGQYPYHCSIHPSMRGTVIVADNTGKSGVIGASSSQAIVAPNPPQIQGGISQYSSESVSQYSQYYRIAPQAPTSEPITPPVVYDIIGNEPQTIYVPGEPAPIPYTQYQYCTAEFGDALWIEGPSSWTQYAAIPRGALINLVATASAEGDADFYWMRPGSAYTVSRYHLFQHNRLGFYADQAGRHVFFFIQGDRPSMSVVVDVVET